MLYAIMVHVHVNQTISAIHIADVDPNVLPIVNVLQINLVLTYGVLILVLELVVKQPYAMLTIIFQLVVAHLAHLEIHSRRVGHSK